MNDRKKTSFRLSQKALKLLKLLAKQNGLSMTAIFELAIRHFAKAQGVDIDE